jgi:hypothetical protein
VIETISAHSASSDPFRINHEGSGAPVGRSHPSFPGGFLARSLHLDLHLAYDE